MTLFICYLTFCVPVHLNSPQKHQQILLDILWPCSLQQPTEKPALFHLTFCVYIHLNCPQKNQHNFLDILWWCSLEQPTEKVTYFAWHFVVMLLEPPTDKPTYFTWHFVFIFTWTAHRKKQHILLNICGHITWTSFREVNIFYLTFCLLCSLKQPTEKPTIEKSSAAKDPTDPPSKGEEYQDETVSEKEDPITKGVYTWQDFILLFLLTHKHYC